jgi:hypothetical protein
VDDNVVINEFGILYCLGGFERVADELQVKAAVKDLDSAKEVVDIRNSNFLPITDWKVGGNNIQSYFEIDNDTTDITMHDVCMHWSPPTSEARPLLLEEIATNTELLYFEHTSTLGLKNPPLGRTGQPLIPISKFTLSSQYAKLYDRMSPADMNAKLPYIPGTTYQTIAMDPKDDLFLHSILPTVARLFPTEIFLNSLDPVFHSTRMPLIHYLVLNNGCASQRIDKYFGEPTDSAFSSTQLMIFAAAVSRSNVHSLNLGYSGCPEASVCFEHLVLHAANVTENHPALGEQLEIRKRSWVTLRRLLFDKFNLNKSSEVKVKEDPTMLPPLRISVLSCLLVEDNALINVEQLFSMLPEWTTSNRPIVLRHFYAFDSLTYGERANVFSQSDIMIAASASDLTLAFLMPNNSTLIEIRTPTKLDTYAPSDAYLRSLEDAFDQKRIILEPSDTNKPYPLEWASVNTVFSEFMTRLVRFSSGYLIDLEKVCEILSTFDVVCDSSAISNPRLQSLRK